MIPLSSAPLPSAPFGPQLISFACGHCQTVLHVDSSLAGVRGPCPRCGSTVEAPRPAVTQSAPEFNTVLPQHPEPHFSPLASVAEAVRPPEVLPNRGFRWRSVAWMLLVGALGGGGAWALRNPGPFSARLAAWRSGAGQGALAGQGTPGATPGSREKRAMAAATQTVHQFLAASTWAEAQAFVTPGSLPMDTGAGYDPKILQLFREARLRQIEAHPVGTKGRYLSAWEADSTRGGGRFHFVVEETDVGPRVRWDVVRQQCGGTLQQFLSTAEAAPDRFMVKLLPTAEKGPKDQILVEVVSPFPGPAPTATRAVLAPGAELTAALGRLKGEVTALALLSHRPGLPQGCVQIDGLFRDSWAQVHTPTAPPWPLSPAAPPTGGSATTSLDVLASQVARTASVVVDSASQPSPAAAPPAASPAPEVKSAAAAKLK
jgi:hypothetical protein